MFLFGIFAIGWLMPPDRLPRRWLSLRRLWLFQRQLSLAIEAFIAHIIALLPPLPADTSQIRMADSRQPIFFTPDSQFRCWR